MQLSEFFDIFNLNTPYMERVAYYVSCRDYDGAKRELLKYFIFRKNTRLSYAEEICEDDRDPAAAYIARHGILSGPNEADRYLSSMFLSHTDEYTTLDIMPFIRPYLSFMIMSRQKEDECAFFYSPSSIFAPYVLFTTKSGEEVKIYPSKYAYVSTSSPDTPLYEEDIYAICEESSNPSDAYGDNTGRVYMGFDFSKINLGEISAARFCAKITLPPSCEKKELLFFNINDSSWQNNLTWSQIKGNVYSWESSPTGPEWISPQFSDSEYLNVTARFWFARPMAYQYLSDVEKNRVYGEKLLFLMDAFSKKKPGGFNRVLETGERLSNFTCVLNALVNTPAMTEDYLVSILDIMYRDMKSLIENPDLGWSNWAVVRTSGLSKAIDFLPELKMHEEWKTHTREVMNNLFDKMYSPDFSFRESGLSYSFWCISLFASAFKMAHINNDPYNAFMRSRLEKAFDASLDALFPNLYDTNIGDSNYISKRAYLKSVGSMFPTKKLKAVIDGKDTDSVALSYYYPYASSAVMRSSFSPIDGIYLYLNASPFDGHAHCDLGSLVLYAYSRPLICDTGRYGYSHSPIASHLKTAAAHNSIEVEGGEYIPHSESGAKMTSFVSNKMFDYACVSMQICENPVASHTRRVLFLKKSGYCIVSDYACAERESKFNQHWHFMPYSNASVDFNNHIKTAFDDSGGNIKIVCSSFLAASVEDDVFSSGYGMIEDAKRATFTSFGDEVAFTTLLIPYKGAEPKVSCANLTPQIPASSNAVFDINSSRGIFHAKNLVSDEFAFYSSDADMVYISGDDMYFAGVSRFIASSHTVIESPNVIKDMYIHISGGIIEIESSSLTKSTNRDEAIKIYSPKTTHVLLNGESVPFTIFSDYVYAVRAI